MQGHLTPCQLASKEKPCLLWIEARSLQCSGENQFRHDVLKIGNRINETGLGGARDKTGGATGLIGSAIPTRCAVPLQSALVPPVCDPRPVCVNYRGTIRRVSHQSRQSAACLSKFRCAGNGLATKGRLCLYLAFAHSHPNRAGSTQIKGKHRRR
jgi:hypothetical protein